MNKQKYKELNSVLDKVGFVLFGIGIAIVWIATHNWIAILGTMVASFDFQLSIDCLDN